jgi:hypothetical protein
MHLTESSTILICILEHFADQRPVENGLSTYSELIMHLNVFDMKIDHKECCCADCSTKLFIYFQLLNLRSLFETFQV